MAGLQVFSRLPEKRGVVVELPNGCVARETQKLSYLSRLVAVVYRESPPVRFKPPTDEAHPVLLSKHYLVLIKRDPVFLLQSEVPVRDPLTALAVWV
jgi:hypothetical protein